MKREMGKDRENKRREEGIGVIGEYEKDNVKEGEKGMKVVEEGSDGVG